MVDKSNDNNLDSEIAKRLDDLFGEGDTSAGDENPIEAAADENPIEEKDTVAEENKVLEKQAVVEEEAIIDYVDVAVEKTDREGVSDDYPLAELKNLVLSIDWEITEEVLDSFLSQIDSLKTTYKNQKIILTFLQLLGSLGVYIKTKRGNAHPKTFKILNSVFSRLEEVVQSANMAESEKKKILRAEMDKYKQLRNQVSKKKAAEVSHKQVISAPKEIESLIQAPLQKEAARSGSKISEKAAKKSPATGPDAAQSIANLAEAVEELKKFIHSELNTLKQELRILQKSK